MGRVGKTGMEELAAPSMVKRFALDREKLETALMVDFGLMTFEDGGWYHCVRTAETNSAVVVARVEAAAARRTSPAKPTASL